MADSLTLNVVPNGLTLNVTSTAVTLNVSPVTITLNGSGVPGPTGSAGATGATGATGAAGSSANIPISDEGTQITPAVSSINFVGSAVAATNVGSAVTVTVTGGGLVSQADQTVLGNVAGTPAVPVPLTQAQIRTFLAYGGAALLNVGTAGGTVAAGNDARLSDSRTPTTRTINNQTGTSYTVNVSDAYKILTLSNAAPVTVIVDTFANQALPVGTEIPLTGIGAGLVTVTAAAGVTINNPTGASLTLAAFMVARLVCIGLNVWELNKGSRPPDGVGIVVNASGQLGLPTPLTVFATAAAGSTASVMQMDGTGVLKSTLVSGIGAALVANNGSDYTNPALFRKNIGLVPQQFETPGLPNWGPCYPVQAVSTTNVATLSGVATPIDLITMQASTAAQPFDVLLANQTTTAQSGPWRIPIGAGPWVRPPWYAASSTQSNPYMYVLGGLAGAATGVSQYWGAQQALIKVDTDSPTFSRQSARTLRPLDIDPAGPVLIRATTQTTHTSVTVSNASATVTDAAIAATDQYQPLNGTGVTGYYVGTVTPGVSFLLSTSPTSQVNVNGLANLASGNIIVGAAQNSYSGFCIMPDGRLFASFGSRTSDSGGIYTRLMGVISTTGGATWGTPFVIYQPAPGAAIGMGPGTCSVLTDGTIVITTFKQLSSITGDIVWLFTCPSGDGVTWNGPIDCTAGTVFTQGSATGSGPIVQTGTNTFVLPFYGQNTGATLTSAAVVTGTFNAGRTAVTSWGTPTIIGNGPVDALAYNETCIIRRNTGDYLCTIRVASTTYYQVTSPDLVNWTAPVQSIVSADGAPNLCQISDGAIALVYRSSQLALLATTLNNGVTWSLAATMPQSGPATGFGGTTTWRYGQIYQTAPNQIGYVYSMQSTVPGAINLYFTTLYSGVGTTTLGTPVPEVKMKSLSFNGVDGDITGGSVSYPATAGMWGHWVFPNTVNNTWSRECQLQKGTYSMVWAHQNAPTYGVWTIYLDGVNIMTTDIGTASGTTINNETTIAGIVVPYSGTHLLFGICSSFVTGTNYGGSLQKFRFKRTDNNS